MKQWRNDKLTGDKPNIGGRRETYFTLPTLMMHGQTQIERNTFHNPNLAIKNP